MPYRIFTIIEGEFCTVQPIQDGYGHRPSDYETEAEALEMLNQVDEVEINRIPRDRSIRRRKQGIEITILYFDRL